MLSLRGEIGFCRLHNDQEMDGLRLVETEGGLGLVVADLTGDSRDVFVEWPTHVGIVAEDEGSLDVEAACDDVFCVLSSEFPCLVWFEFVLEQEFLVI